MQEANLQIINELKQFISLVKSDAKLLEKLTTTEGAFTRHRKLPLERLVAMIAKLCKKTLSVEIEEFFEGLSLPAPCSASAFVQQRMKLDPVFFQLWYRLLAVCFYHY